MFFSVQTLATIGYGRLVPATRAANVLVAVRSAGRAARLRHPQRPAVRAVHAADREDQLQPQRDHRAVPRRLGADVPAGQPAQPRPDRRPRRRVVRAVGRRGRRAPAASSISSRSSATRSSSCRCTGSSSTRSPSQPDARPDRGDAGRGRPGNRLPDHRRRRDVRADGAREDQLRQATTSSGARGSATCTSPTPTTSRSTWAGCTTTPASSRRACCEWSGPDMSGVGERPTSRNWTGVPCRDAHADVIERRIPSIPWDREQCDGKIVHP